MRSSRSLAALCVPKPLTPPGLRNGRDLPARDRAQCPRRAAGAPSPWARGRVNSGQPSLAQQKRGGRGRFPQRKPFAVQPPLPGGPPLTRSSSPGPAARGLSRGPRERWGRGPGGSPGTAPRHSGRSAGRGRPTQGRRAWPLCPAPRSAANTGWPLGGLSSTQAPEPCRAARASPRPLRPTGSCGGLHVRPQLLRVSGAFGRGSGHEAGALKKGPQRTAPSPLHSPPGSWASGRKQRRGHAPLPGLCRGRASGPRVPSQRTGERGRQPCTRGLPVPAPWDPGAPQTRPPPPPRVLVAL